MKKLTFLCWLLLISSAVNAQVVLEHTYNYSATAVKFETLGYKYYLMDVPNAECRIYNLDHSIYKTIRCSVPADGFLADLKYLSQRIFDTDEGIELVYTWYRYIPVNDSYFYEYGSSIINEDGLPITTIDGARYLYLNETGENDWKLLVYCYDYSVWPERIWTNIYRLPGISTYGLLPETEGTSFNFTAYPNPAGSTVKISYTLPPDVTEATLFLFDSNGKVIDQFPADGHTNSLLIDVSVYPAGCYHYSFEYMNLRYGSGKLILH